ncbi:uncharacterized protein SETTUDRAFT_153859 [Exserohilum turcica Et28A]|uniref:Uncharacterized protein n=1 Tax=Exserohilum turcicum (strain 28A) TaxID=671987 RepID=R0KGF9_EXST2|nr:uncharacterized protein SETTUDRAFT_153859 [Exserohilum turcica Et28A]EOA87112.1 hypothetical protein SETTUDRAFT_153859 [Exserohilum turcica Et28A]
MEYSPVQEMLTYPAQLSILELEKEICENGLANCVTYLQALRKRQARNERRLHTDSSLPRKKRKKIQQSTRELKKEIKHRERDEQAFLNSLQACKANIYIAETVSSPSTACSSTIPDLASNSTLCSYPEEVEPTESAWNGWADQTAQSPPRKNSSNPLFVNEMVPDNHSGQSPGVGYSHATRRVPTNGALTRFMLSPEAAVFEPQASCKDRQEDLDEQLARLNLSSSLVFTKVAQTASKAMEDGRLADAEPVAMRRPTSAGEIVEQTGEQDWNATPQQQRPRKEADSVTYRRSRTNSV